MQAEAEVSLARVLLGFRSARRDLLVQKPVSSIFTISIKIRKLGIFEPGLQDTPWPVLLSYFWEGKIVLDFTVYFF